MHQHFFFIMVNIPLSSQPKLLRTPPHAATFVETQIIGTFFQNNIILKKGHNGHIYFYHKDGLQKLSKEI